MRKTKVKAIREQFIRLASVEQAASKNSWRKFKRLHKLAGKLC